MTRVFVPVARCQPPAVATADLPVDPPPAPPSSPTPGLLRMLPALLAVAGMSAMAAAFGSGLGGNRTPMFLGFPIMMMASSLVTAMAVRGRRQGGGIEGERLRYLGYLSQLRATVTETAEAQRSSLAWSHPDPDTLWTLIGGPRMWERRATDPDFCLVRVGTGTQPLATRLVAPPTSEPADPVTTTALQRFLRAHSTIVGPVAIGLRGIPRVTIDGDETAARGTLRAMICQLAVLHPPDQLLIVAAISDRNRRHWEWLKWLPHNQHPSAADGLGAVRMVYRNARDARSALTGVRSTHAVVITDLGDSVAEIAGATVVEVGSGRDGAPVTISPLGEDQTLTEPDGLAPLEALVCARRLAMYRAGKAFRGNNAATWPSLIGIDEVSCFNPVALWHNQDHRDRLRVPIGSRADGARLELDIKEAAENGMGPHGLCIGATGSGKSELLRTIALGMIARNPPDVLNLLLVDFKGGATFLDYARAPHVAAVITNLADDAPLVARMRDALAGEMNRRQRLLRASGVASAAAYERARGDGTASTTLPTLFIIVDEFSELLSQHPDFADLFVAIGRLGRSLGMHLLLASQRLDEGRLRGLDAHLSYRLCLKTLSAGESRAVLGTLDAHQLPNIPGAGYLRTSDGELTRFHAAYVSGPLPAGPPAATPVSEPSVRAFGTQRVGEIIHAIETGGASERTAVHAVLDRLSGHGPPAHQVWLPPLGPAPALHTVLRDAPRGSAALTVPLGIVDRPFEQSRTPLMVDLRGAAGNVAVVGAPQSGKSTALRTLITALAATHDPRQVQFYCLDFGGGALTSTRTIQHVGAVAGRAEQRLVARIVAECESVIRSREAIFSVHGIGSMAEYRQLQAQRKAPDTDPFGDIFLLVDGWATLREQFAILESSVTAIATQGLSFGVHVVVSASRWAEVRPALRDQIGTRIELRLGDPADSEVDRKAAQHVPQGKPGRGLSSDGSHMMMALPLAEIGPTEFRAPPIPVLPKVVERDTVVTRVGDRIVLGIDEHRLQPVTCEFDRHAHLLVLGDKGCGKTATLRTLCRELVRTKTHAQANLVIVDFRRSLLGVVETEHLGAYAISPGSLAGMLPDLLDLLRRRMPPVDATPTQPRAGSGWSGPDIYLVVDDYDLVAGPAGNPLAPITEYLPYATDLGLHLLITRRSGGAERALFEPLLAAVRDFGCTTLMMSGSPGEHVPFGSGRPALLPPGRGVLHTGAGDEQLVQVAWSAP
ncbi:type VII secretion protein EccC [Mycobacterium sp. 852002-51613_SCH5001154]|uniref:type VII secretion protein EccCa n=1 Tax=Mycobacterium sp. 852002-51613_SCH5001154 TaxID=1834104 RepID=UPI0007FEA74A|nr:type VII secretion protein EccCa [Mycobacterium sp. 852002-51613_SCH5001154]OBF73513.1 type VII secretion protein EccC [Mycobacterium sp. 852002-51613_SCH5001154]